MRTVPALAVVLVSGLALAACDRGHRNADQAATAAQSAAESASAASNAASNAERASTAAADNAAAARRDDHHDDRPYGRAPGPDRGGADGH